MPEKLRKALRDQLTGCRSRKALSFAYDGDFAKNQSIALIMCDLNGLKKKNDTKGHEAGDKYLCDAAEVLFACFGNENVYRVGGDEFVIVLFDVDLNAVNEKIDKMLVYLELKEVSMAYGFAYRKNAKEPFENLLREADKRCMKTNADIMTKYQEESIRKELQSWRRKKTGFRLFQQLRRLCCYT